MNFLESITRDIQDTYRQRGRRDRVEVGYAALAELLHHFNVLESEHRAMQPDVVRFSPNQHLADAITAAFHASNGRTEEILKVVVDVLYQLTQVKRRSAPCALNTR